MQEALLTLSASRRRDGLGCDPGAEQEVLWPGPRGSRKSTGLEGPVRIEGSASVGARVKSPKIYE